MNKVKILGTGLAGLIGSQIVALLSSSYAFENCSRTTGVDITNAESIDTAIAQSDASIVLHLAAKADVDGCEKDKSFGKDGQAWQINVEGTRNVARACEKHGKKMVYVSTDFVFDGQYDVYSEDDVPHPINWYAQTKYEGEKIVQQMKTSWIITRIAYPYRTSFLKNDFVRAIKGRLANNEGVTMVTDHIMTPTFVDDIAYGMQTLFEKNSTGIYHLVGSQFISPFNSALTIAALYGFDKALIEQTTRSVFFEGRAQRPFRLALKNDKICMLGVVMKTFDDGLKKIQQETNNA